MPSFKFQLDATDTLVSNQTKTIQLGVDASTIYRNIKVGFYTSAGALVTNAQLAAEVTNIRLMVDSNPVIDCSPATLQRFYSMYNADFSVPTSQPGTVELNLANYLFADNTLAKKVFSLNLGGVNRMSLVITTGTLTNVAGVRVRYVKEPLPVNPSNGLIQLMKFESSPRLELTTFQQISNSTGQLTFSNFPKDQTRAYYAFNVTPGAAGVISDSRVKVGMTELREAFETAINAAALSDYGVLQPTGHYTHMLGLEDPTQGIQLVSTTDIQIITTFTTAPGAAGFTVEALSGVNVPAELAKQMFYQ